MEKETSDELRKRLKIEHAAEQSDNSGNDTGNGDSPKVSATSRDIEQYAPNFPNQDGYGIQSVSRPGLGAISVGRAVSKSKRKSIDIFRGTTQGDIGDGYTTRRSGKNNSQGGSNGTDLPASSPRTTTRSVGGLETDEPIPPRTFEPEEENKPRALFPITTPKTEPAEREITEPRKRGRPTTKGIVQHASPTPETTKQERKIPKFLTGSTFSKQEAKELQEPLIAALQDELSLVDKALWSLTGDVLQQPVWSDVTDKEMESLTNILLKLGQKSPAVATATRAAIDGSDYISAGVIIAPRFAKTAQIIREVRLQKKAQNENLPKQSRVERIRNRRRQIT